MERLTKRSSGPLPVLVRGKALGPAYFMSEEEYEDYRDALNRLAAYEDTGLEPEICAEYKKFEDEAVSKNVPFSRIIELMDAESEGRLLVLPCKPNDIVYSVDRKHGWIHRVFMPSKSCIVAEMENGVELYYTREEAEAALKQEVEIGG